MKMNIFRILAVAAVFAALPSLASHSGPFDYYTLPPCRVVDTRNPTATNGGPILAGGVTRTFAIRGACGVPMNARAVTLNVTITGASASSYVTLWSPDFWQPITGTITSSRPTWPSPTAPSSRSASTRRRISTRRPTKAPCTCSST